MKSYNKFVVRQIHGAIQAIGAAGSHGLVPKPHPNNDRQSRHIAFSQSWAKAYIRTMFPYLTELGVNTMTRSQAVDGDAFYGPTDPDFDLGPNQVLVLNREYKPLGVAAYKPDVTYSEWPCVVDLTEGSEFKRGACGTDRAHPLYQDCSTPWSSMSHWRTYAEQLAALLVDIGASQAVLDDLAGLTRAWTEAGRRR